LGGVEWPVGWWLWWLVGREKHVYHPF
jgi:hypothetical protein